MIPLLHPRLDLCNLVINNLLHAGINRAVPNYQIGAVNALWDDLHRRIWRADQRAARAEFAGDARCSPGVEFAVGPDYARAGLSSGWNGPAVGESIDVVYGPLWVVRVRAAVCIVPFLREEEIALALPVASCYQT
jgi:hypothetical protein